MKPITCSVLVVGAFLVSALITRLFWGAVAIPHFNGWDMYPVVDGVVSTTPFTAWSLITCILVISFTMMFSLGSTGSGNKQKTLIMLGTRVFGCFLWFLFAGWWMLAILSFVAVVTFCFTFLAVKEILNATKPSAFHGEMYQYGFQYFLLIFSLLLFGFLDHLFGTYIFASCTALGLSFGFLLTIYQYENTESKSHEVKVASFQERLNLRVKTN